MSVYPTPNPLAGLTCAPAECAAKTAHVSDAATTAIFRMNG
jgi:hypothetical protein